jgi:hypothetical protein
MLHSKAAPHQHTDTRQWETCNIIRVIINSERQGKKPINGSLKIYTTCEPQETTNNIVVISGATDTA